MNGKKLFSDNFPDAKLHSELVALFEKYPSYDVGYICQGAVPIRNRTKAWMESLWRQYQSHADVHFLEEFKRQFTQRTWELYLGATLLEHGFRLGTQRECGPDFELVDPNGKRLAWIEAIAVTKGTGMDRVPDLIENRVTDIPTNEIVLRIASALDAKFQKYQNYLAKGIVKKEDSFVIALDRSTLEHLDALLPNILKALFGIGTLALRVRVGGQRVKNPETSWTSQFEIKKRSGESVPMLFFENHGHSGISAVIYSTDHAINSPRDPKEMGENLTIVHNPHAKNPLPKLFFPFGDIWLAEKGYVKKIRNRKPFQKPDPFSW